MPTARERQTGSIKENSKGEFRIDPFKVSIAILAGVQSRLKLQQMYGKLFNFQTL